MRVRLNNNNYSKIYDENIFLELNLLISWLWMDVYIYAARFRRRVVFFVRDMFKMLFILKIKNKEQLQVSDSKCAQHTTTNTISTYAMLICTLPVTSYTHIAISTIDSMESPPFVSRRHQCYQAPASTHLYNQLSNMTGWNICCHFTCALLGYFCNQNLRRYHLCPLLG